jgi:4-diphosphocytidyl-2-C-methyl-D-erythritol kinase
VPFFVGGGVALVEGRGERLTGLNAPIGKPVGIVLVTPAVAVSTTAVFRCLDQGGDAAPADPRSARMTSEHLAQELRGGLRAHDLVSRAGVLSTANDLGNATAALVPELRAFRRALARRLGRTVGQSGSGPTLWALYPSLAAAEAAAADLEAGFLEEAPTAPGDGAPRIHATTIAADEPDSRRKP